MKRLILIVFVVNLLLWAVFGAGGLVVFAILCASVWLGRVALRLMGLGVV